MIAPINFESERHTLFSDEEVNTLAEIMTTDPTKLLSYLESIPDLEQRGYDPKYMMYFIEYIVQQIPALTMSKKAATKLFKSFTIIEP